MTSDKDARAPLSRGKKTVIAMAALFAVALIASALIAWRQRVDAMKPRTLELHQSVVAFAFTPRGDEIVTVSGVRLSDEPWTLARWSEPTGRPLARTTFSAVGVTALDAAPLGDVVAIADMLGKVHVVRLQDGGESSCYVPRRPQGGMADANVRFSPLGDRIALNGLWGALCVLDAHDPARLAVERPHQDCKRVLGFISDDEVAYVGSGALEVWSVSKRAITQTLPAMPADSVREFVSPRTTRWISSELYGEPHEATVRRLPGGEPVGMRIPVPAGSVAAFSPDDALVAVASVELVSVHEVTTGAVLFTHRFEAPSRDGVDTPTAVAFSPTADRVAVARGTTVLVFPFSR